MKNALVVFDEVFSHVFAGPSWDAWRAFLAALYGLPASEQYASVIRACTGRQALPTTPAREVCIVKGRRAGGSRIVAFLVTYLAAFRTYSLAAGEVGVVMTLAADRRQARVILKYVVGLFESVPMLSAMIVEQTKESITLSNGIVIEIHTSSYRSVRGFTIVAAVADELAFWATDDTAANPDAEVLKALRPAMATIPNALLMLVSSPYARKGELWRSYQAHYGRDGDSTLVWQADSRTMNPTLDPQVVADAYADDEAAAAAEYGAQFRTDIETFLGPELVASAVLPDQAEFPPRAGVEYVAFTDPAGGSGKDAYTLAVAHLEGQTVVLDYVREVTPKFSPDEVTAEFAATVKRYNGLRTVRGDHYAGDWPSEAWSKHGVTYRPSELTKSALYLEALPLFTSGRVRILDVKVLKKQLTNLERRTGRHGKDAVDHPPGQRDDVANAVCGALVWAADAKRQRAPLAIITAPRTSETTASNFVTAMRAAKSERLRRELEASRRMPAE